MVLEVIAGCKDKEGTYKKESSNEMFYTLLFVFIAFLESKDQGINCVYMSFLTKLVRQLAGCN